MKRMVAKYGVKNLFSVSGVVIQGYVDSEALGPIIKTKLTKAFKERRQILGWGEASKIFYALTRDRSCNSGLCISEYYFSCPSYADSKLQELFLHAVIKDMTLRKMNDGPDRYYMSNYIKDNYERVSKDPCGQFWNFAFKLDKKFIQECAEHHAKVFDEKLPERAELFDKLSQALKENQAIHFQAV